MNTEKALAELLDKKAIEELRYKYWFAILDKDIDALLSVFADDVKLEYGFGIELNSKDEIRSFFQQLLGAESLKAQVPRGANGLIELTSDTTGKGRWLVEAISLNNDAEKASLASVQYFEDYVKIDGDWKLSRMKNDYLYFEEVTITAFPNVKSA